MTGSQPARLGLALWGTEPALALAEQAALAEAVGFESVWVIDSQLLCREVYVTLAACLARTRRLRVSTGVTQPVTRHVSVTASAIATLDEIAPGRVMLGMGSGFSSLGTIGKRAAKVDAVADCARTLRALLDGRRARFDQDVEAGLAWIDGPTGIPIHLAATGPRMTRCAGAHGDGAILLNGSVPALLDRAIGWLDEGSVAAGRPAGSVEISAWVAFSLDPDRRVARDRVRTRVAGGVVNAQADWFEGAERDAVLALKADYAVGDHARASAEHAAVLPDSLVDKFAVAGDAAEVRDHLRRLRAHPRLSRIILVPQVSGPGAVPMATVLRSVGETLMPHL